MTKTLIATTAIAAAVLLSQPAAAGILYGHGSFDDTLYRIDTTAQTVTAVGTSPAERYGPEIQMTPDGTNIYMFRQTFAQTSPLLSVDPSNGQTTASLTLSGYPQVPTQSAFTDTLTALEYANGTLYGSAHQAGPEIIPGVLVSVDTGTGALTEIGAMTGMNRPTGGMDYFNGTMYAISSTNNNDSSLFTVDLGTGAASLIAALTIGGNQAQSVTGLASVDGIMYGIVNFETGQNLYAIDLATGVMTAQFSLGVDMNSLTAQGTASVPEPGMAAVLGLGVLGLGALRRRRVA